MTDGEHLLVQAGTGTGKSLAYLVPALLHGDTGSWSPPRRSRCRTSSSTATCRPRRRGRAAARPAADLRDPQGPVQLPVPQQGARRDARRRRRRAVRPVADDGARPRRGAAARLGRGDRDRRPRRARPGRRRPGLAAGQRHRARVPGRGECPFGEECFAEQARDRAAEAEIVVTNHALLAIDALESFAVLPEHDAVVVDEAHELVDRVTGVATDELTVADGRAGRGPGPAAGRRHGRPDRRRRRRSRRRWPRCRRAGRRAARGAGHRRSPWCATRRAHVVSEIGRGQGRRRRRAQGRDGGGRGGVRDRRADRRPLAVRRDLGGARPAPRGRCVRASPRCRSTACCARRCSASASVVLTSATLELGGASSRWPARSG